MGENHVATAVLVVGVLFAVVGVVQLIRGLLLIARARRASIEDLFDGWPAKNRARGAMAYRVSAVFFLGAIIALMLVHVSNTHY